MENLYTTERLIALLISIVVGTIGKIAYLSHKKQRIDFSIIFQTIGLGLFGGFISDNFLVLKHLEGWRFMAVPFCVYSSTYFLTFWEKDYRNILTQILSFFLGKLKTDDNGKQDTDSNSEAGDN